VLSTAHAQRSGSHARQRRLSAQAGTFSADTQKRAQQRPEYTGRVAEIGDFLDARLAYVQSLP